MLDLTLLQHYKQPWRLEITGLVELALLVSEGKRSNEATHRKFPARVLQVVCWTCGTLPTSHCIRCCTDYKGDTLCRHWDLRLTFGVFSAHSICHSHAIAYWIRRPQATCMLANGKAFPPLGFPCFMETKGKNGRDYIHY